MSSTYSTLVLYTFASNESIMSVMEAREMNAKVVEFLRESMQDIKAEFAQVGITPRQFSRFGGDKEYTTDELLKAMEDVGIPWDEEVGYDAIIVEPLFVKAVRWQAAYNSVA